MAQAFNSVVAHVDGRAIPGRIQALEGGRGVMRVALHENAAALPTGSECVLEMHDGARFRVTVTEHLDDGSGELRVKLVGKA